MIPNFPHLFSSLSLRGTEIRNRILSTGHQTYLARANLPSDEMIAYHEARARGGIGLIVNEAVRFHASQDNNDSHALTIFSDDAIAHYARLAAAVHRHGAKIFGQLSHVGRLTRMTRNGMRGVVYAPSSVPESRFHVVAREMPTEMVAEIIGAAADGARRYAEAGYDGVEVTASHGLLFSQFLNPVTNLRQDIYGGSPENRLRPLREALAGMRRAVGDGVVVGIRISAEEGDEGLDRDTVLATCRQLAEEGLVDYINTTFGTMAGLGGSVHVVPPMEIEAGYVAPRAAAIRAVAPVPVFVTGRINQPQIAEGIIASGQADMCGMTRAMIADPDMPRKAKEGRADEIRACIGCNQACIGHLHNGTSISCIQNPSSGRELHLPPTVPHSRRALRVLVAGGGPAGMRAAVTAAELGHTVILAEAAAQLGGQALLAQLLPDRAEFGGLVTNLVTELKSRQVEIRLNTRVTAAMLGELAPDAAIIATGSAPVETAVEGREAGHVITAQEILRGSAQAGSRVVVADWRCDWIGIGLAILLNRRGHHVRLAVNGICAGQNLQQYLRDHWAGKLHEAGVVSQFEFLANCVPHQGQ